MRCILFFVILLAVLSNASAAPPKSIRNYHKRLIQVDPSGKVAASVPWRAGATGWVTALVDSTVLLGPSVGPVSDRRLTTRTVTLRSGEWVEIVQVFGWTAREASRKKASKIQELREKQARLGLIAVELSRLSYTAAAIEATAKSTMAKNKADDLETP